jgi:hypothetical protein
MGNKMNNQTGVEILSSILERMTYSNIVLSKNDADCPGVIDVKSLHNLLLKRCLEMNNPQKLKTLSGGS